MIARKEVRTVVSRYKKGDKVATLTNTTFSNGSKCEVWFRFENWNPLPVKGRFQSTFSVIHQWLIDNGWTPVVRETHIVHDATVVREVTTCDM